MKKILLWCLFSTVMFMHSVSFGKETRSLDSLGLPGDNLNLYGVLNIFQQSETLEIFEKRLNSQDSKVNNLDLNSDGEIDYIKVIDHANGSAHAIVLQAIITEKETQDVAVIEIEKDKDNQIYIQIIGDEALYGKDYIVEPKEGNSVQSTPNPGYTGTTATNKAPATVNWTIIGFMYAPAYVVYSSPYYWGYYPNYWHPWRPSRYKVYYGYNRPYYGYYHRGNSYRAPVAHSYYGPRRTSSVTVTTKQKSGIYHQNTYRPTSGQRSSTKEPQNSRSNNPRVVKKEVHTPPASTKQAPMQRTNAAPHKNTSGNKGGGSNGRKR